MSRLPHTWCNVHIETPLHPEQVPDERVDVFEAVARVERASLEYHNLNLNGKTIMEQTTLGQALNDAGVRTFTRNAYIDILGIAEKHLPDASRDFWARVTNSMAWRADMAVINKARGAFYALYSESERGDEISAGDHFNDFIHQVGDQIRQDSLWSGDIAKSELIELRQLMKIRLDWHEIAMSAAAAADRDYNPKGIGEMLVDEKPAKASLQTMALYEVAAKRSSGGDPLKYARRMEQFQFAHDVQAKDLVSRNKRLIHVVEVVLAEADRQMDHDAVLTNLPKATQRQLVDFLMQTIERVSSTDMAKDRKMTIPQYTRVLDASDAAIDELKTWRTQHCDEADDLEAQAARTSKADVREKLRSFRAPAKVVANEQQQRDAAKAAGREHVDGVTGA